MTLKQKIALAEKESNDLEKIEQEKRQLDALRAYTARPLYKEPETLLEKIKRWWNGEPRWCKKHECYETEHGFEGKMYCTECRKEENAQDRERTTQQKK